MQRLFFTEQDFKKAQYLPLTGESPIHFKAKCRVREICRDSNFTALLEMPFFCNGQLKYRCDVFAMKDITNNIRRIWIEIDGPGGHKTKHAYEKDIAKVKWYKDLSPLSEHYRFSYKAIIGKKKWTDAEIKEEMDII